MLLILINFFKQKVFNSYELNNEVIVQIPLGSNLNDITHILIQNSINKEELFFKSWVKFNRFGKKLKAGEYLIRKTMNLNSLMLQLYNGKSVIHFLRIDDGITKYKLSEKIKKVLPRFKNFSVNFLPDYLIADTYDYTLNDSKERFMKNISVSSMRKVAQIWEQRDKSIPLKSIDDLFIIASIIEKETGKKNEKTLIASVFYNRLKRNMKLQSDPTVIFSITDGKDFKRELSKKDLKTKSLFNTYVTRGLPPLPICHPSLSSLKAAAKPKNTNFLYFVADGYGGHFFAKNYKEHKENIIKFKNVKKSRK